MLDASQMAPGHYPGLTNDAYHSGPGTSKSHLDDIAPPNSPLHYWQKRINPNRDPEVKTPALILGDAIHKAVLEPDLVSQHFVTVPEDAPSRPSSRTRNAKNPSADSRAAIAWWNDFNASVLGKTILTEEQYKAMIGARDAVYRCPLARGLLTEGVSEQTYYSIDPETGELIKCRVDFDRLARHGMMVDIKSTESAAEEAFGKSACTYRYHVQGWWYPHVASQLDIDVRNFVFIAIEKEPPYAIGVYYLEPEDAMIGMVEARRDLARIAQCKANDNWPDFADRPKPLQLPAWKRAQFARMQAAYTAYRHRKSPC